MKLKNIFKFATIAVASGTLLGVTSCNYLDVVPPEQPGLADAMKNHDNALGFLYSCYNKVSMRDFSPRDYRSVLNAANDEFVLPETWYAIDNPAAYAVMRNTLTTSPMGYDPDFWNQLYNGIGQTLLFERELDGEGAKNNVCRDAAEYAMWKAESRFCRAFYHFQLLRLFGPIAITDHLVDMEVTMDQYPGRSHFDTCVDWIASELKACADVLPATRTEVSETGRATSVICKALIARLRLYAASPLWNGEFAYPTWTDKNGNKLVNTKYNPEKWQVALDACAEALDAALTAGHQLYDQRENDALVNLDGVNYDYNFVNVPGLEELEGTPGFDGEDGRPYSVDLFKRTVQMMRYLNATTQAEGNTEIIWSNNFSAYGWLDARLPRRASWISKDGSGTGEWKEGWNGVNPTLYTVEHFLNYDGSLPFMDSSAYSARYQVSSYADEEERPNLLNIAINREPRFYAWIGFDSGDYLTKLRGTDKEPLVLNMRDPEMQGHGQGERNYSVTGFLSMKHVDPSTHWDKEGGFSAGTNSPDVLIRTAELYLNLAECEAMMAGGHKGMAPVAPNPSGYYASTFAGKYSLGSNLAENAMTHVNVLRERAYVGRLTNAHIGAIETFTDGSSPKTWDLVEWVRNERFIELWDEGHRYFDVRRWAAGPEYFGYGKRMGLNGVQVNVVDPDKFNVPVLVNAQYTFHKRLYLYPMMVAEVYKNPQMVQAPGY